MMKKITCVATWMLLSHMGFTENPSTFVPVSGALPSGEASDKELDSPSVEIKVEGASFQNFKLYLQFSPSKIQDQKLYEKLVSGVKNDLRLVGGLDYINPKVPDNTSLSHDFLKQAGAQGACEVLVSQENDNLLVSLKNTNLVTSKVSTYSLKSSKKSMSNLVHHVAMKIYGDYVAKEDIFVRQIAAVKTDSAGKQQIVLMDFDGGNEKTITNDDWVKFSPSFSPDGRSILYGVGTKTGHGIIEQNLVSGRRTFMTKKEGINMEPVVTSDNKCVFATLSYGKRANIFRLQRDGRVLGKLMDSLGVNLSPSLSLNNKELAFVSTRSGNPQIYLQELSGCTLKGTAKQVTHQGKYNQTPSLSPRGDIIAFTGRDEEKVFDVFIVNTKTNKIARVTEDQGRNESPKFTPSGRFLYFISTRKPQNQKSIYFTNLAGSNQNPITKKGKYDSVVVSPKIN